MEGKSAATFTQQENPNFREKFPHFISGVGIKTFEFKTPHRLGSTTHIMCELEPHFLADLCVCVCFPSFSFLGFYTLKKLLKISLEIFEKCHLRKLFKAFHLSLVFRGVPRPLVTVGICLIIKFCLLKGVCYFCLLPLEVPILCHSTVSLAPPPSKPQ